MRTRKWVIIVVLIALAGTSLSLYSWRVFSPNERLKAFLLSQIRPILGPDCDIERIRLSLGYVRFMDVYLPVPDQDILIQIDEMRVGYNLWQLVSQGFNPQAISQDILLERPEITIIHRPSGSTASLKSKKPDSLTIDYQEQFENLGILRRVSITQGEIYYQRQNNRLPLAHSITGFLFARTARTMDFKLEGNLFDSSQENLFLQGQIQRDKKTLYLKAELFDYPVVKSKPLLDSLPVNFSDGILNAKLEFYNTFVQHRNTELVINGFFDIAQFAGSWPERSVAFTEFNAHIAVEKNQITVKEGQGILNKADVRFQGRVGSIFKPVLDFTVSTENMRLENLFTVSNALPDKSISGRSRIEMNITGEPGVIEIHGQAKSSGVRIYDMPFSEFVSQWTFKEQYLQLESRARTFDQDIELQGGIDFAESNRFIDGSLNMKGDLVRFFPSVVADSLSSVPIWLQAEIGGELNNPALYGQTGINIISATHDSLPMLAAFAFKDRFASLTHIHQNGSPKINARVHLKTYPLEFELQVDQFEKIAAHLWHFPFEKDLHRLFRAKISLQGNTDQWRTLVSVDELEGGMFVQKLFDIDAKSEINDQGNWMHGNLIFYPESEKPLNADFGLLVNQKTWRLNHFNIDNRLKAHVHLTKGPEGHLIDGQVSINQLNLLDVTNTDKTDGCHGLLSGEIIYSGMLHNPVVNGDLVLNDVYCFSDGPYETEMQFSVLDHVFELDHLYFNTQNATLLDAHGRYDIQQDSMNFTIKGAGFDIATLNQAGAPGKAHISGQTLIDINVNGSARDPDINGVIAIKDGRLFKMHFDEFEMFLGHQKRKANITDAPGLALSRMRLLRREAYEINGNGFIPFNSSDSLMLNLMGQGNFLAIVPELEDYFKEPSSTGRFSAGFRGTLKRPRLINADLDFTDASMKFGSVVPQVTDVSGKLRYEPEHRFLHLVNLEGKMGGEWFRISNQLASPELSSRTLENMDVGGQGLNFGVFILESSKKGVPLNITGLMEHDVWGHLHLMGREPGEKFMLAGPIERPVVRGRLDLQKFEFRYPFETDENAEDNIVVIFLKSIDWNVIVYPREDVRYVNTLPGALDQVYVNLQVEEDWGSVDFSGQIADESFAIEGEARSTAGFVEYLDMNFRVQQGQVEFDHGSIFPVVTGEARTMVTDSLGIPSQIILTLQTVDRTMDKKNVDDIVRQETGRGRWDKIRFKLTSDNPNLGSNEAQILASLGYSTETLQSKAFDAIGISTENILFRPLYRPVERELEQFFNLDYVRFSSRFTRNLIWSNLTDNPALDTRLSLLRSTKLIVGKYLVNQLFIQYTGQIESGIDYKYQNKNIGLRHTLGLEYRINPKLLLELEYDYNSMIIEDRDDKRIVLRHWFPF